MAATVCDVLIEYSWGIVACNTPAFTAPPFKDSIRVLPIISNVTPVARLIVDLLFNLVSLLIGFISYIYLNATKTPDSCLM